MKSDENLEQTEDNKIKEYLQRSDTAVIFAEPVDKDMERVQKITHLNKIYLNQTNGQSIEESFGDRQRRNLLSNEKSSSKQSMSYFVL